MAITIRNDVEIDNMRFAGRILGSALKELRNKIVPGVSCLELDAFFEEYIKKNNCKSNFKGYQGFPNTICISINEELIHGIPSKRILKDGDIVKIDAGCTYKGMHVDSAISVICGSIKDPAHKKLIDVTEKSLYLAISQARPGKRIGDISSTIQRYVESEGYHLPTSFTGHGIGHELHEEPYIPNVGEANKGIRLVEGMTICIEPMVQIGTAKTIIKEDNWTVVSADNSLTAHFEHTILVSNTPEIITLVK